MTEAKPEKSPKPARRPLRRSVALLVALIAIPLLLWIAIKHIPWLGPLFADTARSVLGPAAVGRMEDIAYGIDDWWTRKWRAGDAPEAYWDVATDAGGTAPTPPMPAASSSASAPPSAVPSFRPADLAPMHSVMFARGDGVWVPCPDPVRADAPPSMFKTLLHPDFDRAWSTVAIVAVDLRRVRLSIAAGREEPKSTTAEGATFPRPGLIPQADQPALLAAFNGGFKTVNGMLGMFVSGVTLVPPQKWGCTIASYQDSSLAIRTWTDLAASRDRMTWWRQAPTCIVELGVLGPGVTAEGNINWGKSVEGSTIIRRSAIGLSRDAGTLFVGMGDATSAGTMAQAMKHAGAWDVAQLDVNVPYPKFLFFAPAAAGGTSMRATPLTPWMAYESDEYVVRPSKRDFFYLTRLP